MPDVTLRAFNTMTLTANTVYRLIMPAPGGYYLNVLNLGPGTMYIRANADPAANDPDTETLPAMTADNDIPFDGLRGLRLLCDVDSSITARPIVP